MRLIAFILLALGIGAPAAAQVGSPAYIEHVARCEAGEGYACAYAAQLGQRGDQTFWLADEQVRLRILGCRFGQDGSCWKFERIGNPNPYASMRNDQEAFLPMVREGCRNGSAMACFQAARELFQRNGPGDWDEALEHGELGCVRGFSDACAIWTDVLEAGGDEAAAPRAMACYGTRPGYLPKAPYCEAGCEAGDREACLTLATMYELGRDGALHLHRDTRRARQLRTQASALSPSGPAD
ncbi:hypothetical protein [Maricaulis sp.]|uniref:hypothetical protein n=1 Tax=Maricaulis sp. TaxID=1486257 RepID=UPI0026214287|nr:hypothetical protein [Maricaulis sp.]